MNHKSRIGIVGGGRWAQVHARSLLESGAELVGFLVATETTRDRLAEEWKRPATTDANAFFKLPMDGVVIASPNHLHASHTLTALQHGMHVLVEKPMALTVEDCTQMIQAAQQAQCVLAVGLEMRGFTLFARVKQLIEEGQWGSPLNLHLDLSRKPHRSGAGGWKSDPLQRGAPALEEPVHYLDLMRWYFRGHANPTRLLAKSTSRPGREALQEILDVVVELEGNRNALVTRNLCSAGHHVRLRLVLEKGTVEASWDGSQDADPNPAVSLRVHDANGTSEVPVDPKTGHAYDVPRQTEAFLRAVQGSGEALANAEDGRESVLLCCAVEGSLTSGVPVLLNTGTLL